MCNCRSVLEFCIMFSGVKLSIRSFNLFQLYRLFLIALKDLCCPMSESKQ